MYVNYATTLLKKWLLKNGCKFLNDAATTSSSYFIYKDVRIRIGDHLPTSVGNNTVYIMIPQSKKAFGLFVDRNYNSFNTLSELKQFLSNLFFMLDCDFKSKLAAAKIEESKNAVNVNELQQKIKNQSATLSQQAELIKKYKTENLMLKSHKK